MTHALLYLLVPALIGALATALFDISRRFAVQGRPSPTYFVAWGFSAITATLLAIYLVRYGLTMPRELLEGFWRAVFIGSIANVAIQFLSAKVSTMEKGEVSFVAPLSATTPGLVTILAVLLGEYPGPVAILGIALMILGSWVLLYPGSPKKWWYVWEYLSPFKRLALVFRFRSLSKAEKQRSIVVWLTLLGALLSTIGLICDGLYTRRGVDMQGMWLAVTVLSGFLAACYICMYLVLDRETKRGSGSLFEKRFFFGLIGYTAAWVAVMWITTPLYNEAFIAYVGTLKRLSIIFSVLLGFWLFGEGDRKKRLIVATLIILGAVLISSEELPERLANKIELLGL